MNKGDLVSVNETLLRKVYIGDKRYIDKKTGRPTSRAFAPRPQDEAKLSVDIKSLTNYFEAIGDQHSFLLFSILSKLVYDLNLQCVFDPEDDNLAHALISGFDPDDESVPGILARASTKETPNF
jgi:hypothetical protein